MQHLDDFIECVCTKRSRRVPSHVFAKGYNYNRLRKGEEMFLGARFLILTVSRSGLSGIRGFMRTTMCTSERRALLNSIDRPLKTGSGAVNPTGPHAILGCYRVPPAGQGRGIPGLFDSLNRHRDNNVRIMSSSTRISASLAFEARQRAASSIPIGPDYRWLLLLEIMSRTAISFHFSTISRYLPSLSPTQTLTRYAAPRLLIVSYMQVRHLVFTLPAGTT